MENEEKVINLEEPIESTEELETIEEPIENIESEASQDEDDTFKDEVEQPFYATNEMYDELRDILEELEYRLFLINDNMIIVGRLNGDDIELLNCSKNGEECSYFFVKAPDRYEDLLKNFNTIFISDDMLEEEKEKYKDNLGDFDSIIEFLVNELPEEKRDDFNSEESVEEPTEEPEEVISEEE